MFSLLPDLAPRDSYSLWYTSSRNPLATYDVNLHSNDNPSAAQGVNQRRHTQFLERSPLARLRADEQTLERRLHNVSSFGCTWLKPPGIPKTLHQMREERREQEEHQEALRREQLAQELAEAEAAGLDNFEGGPEGQGEDGMDDVQLDGARDLDEDIPEANDADFGLSGDEEDADDDDDDEEEGEEAQEGMEQRAARTQQALMAQRMRQAGGEAASGGTGFYGGEDEVDEEDQAHLIQEDDVGGDGDGVEMDMDADLDDDIPEAESALGGYEHTDSEAELSSSTSSDGEDQAEMSFARPRAPQANRFRNSLARSDVTRQSIAVSDLLSRDESSFFDSSPEVPRHGGRPSRS